MILLRIMIEMLIAIGKIKTGHATLCAFASQIELGEILGESRTDRAEDPIEVAAAFDAGALVGEIPNVTSPRLQLDELQRGVLQHLDLNDPRVHRIGSLKSRARQPHGHTSRMRLHPPGQEYARHEQDRAPGPHSTE